MPTLRFHAGTLEVHGFAKKDKPAPELRWDERTACFRAPAMAYAPTVMTLRKAGIEYEDEARDYPELEAGALVMHEPRPYQREALEEWKKRRGRGVVVLPTGAGKTHLALMGIDLWRRSTLVVAPTLDLVRQWYDRLRTAFRTEVGIVGGGEHEVRALTVTTYDSAYIHMEHLGNRFGLVVFDECHHLPGETYALAAKCCLAPFRLGLTATPERPDGRDSLLGELIGPTVFRRDIVDLSGDFLADYDTQRVVVDLSPEERQEYDSERAIYRAFVTSRGIRFQPPRRLVAVHPAVVAVRGGTPRDACLPPPARARVLRAGEARLRGRPAAPASQRSHDPVHAGQRHLLRSVAPILAPRDYAPDEGEGAQRHPLGALGRALRRGGDLEGAQRGRRRTGGERGPWW